jgi:hypothetical protein
MTPKSGLKSDPVREPKSRGLGGFFAMSAPGSSSKIDPEMALWARRRPSNLFVDEGQIMYSRNFHFWVKFSCFRHAITEARSGAKIGAKISRAEWDHLGVGNLITSEIFCEKSEKFPKIVRKIIENDPKMDPKSGP